MPLVSPAAAAEARVGAAPAPAAAEALGKAAPRSETRSRTRRLYRLWAAALVFAAALGAAAARQNPADPAAAFARGKAALERNQLAVAEREFRAVLAADPQATAAMVNLGVIKMRRHRWPEARQWLERAARRTPGNPGIQLDLALTYFQQGDYHAAIAPLSAVLRQSDTFQARYLLGLCDFFDDQDAAAVRTLAPLWSRANRQVEYLYVLGLAADNAHEAAWRQRAMSQLVAVGQNTPPFHLMMGKAYLNHLENDKALAEFQTAAAADPKLPFVHFYLGVVYQREHKFAQARAEFEQDIALEPDVAYDYDHLGAVLSDMNLNRDAAGAFQQALRRDPRLASSYYGLGKVEVRQHQYRKAIAHLRSADRLSPNSASVHYLLGQAYLHAGDRAQAQAEFAAALRLQQSVRDKLEEEISGESLPADALAPHRNPQM